MSYSYSSYSSSGYGGDAFSQADTNRDGVVDRGEFQNFVGGTTLGAAGLGGAGFGAAGLGGGVSSYESSYSSGGSYGAGLVGGGAVDASFASGGVVDAGFAGGVVAGGADLVSGGVSSYDASYSSGAYGAGAVGLSGTTVQTTQYAADAQGIYQDPNPQIIRRPAPGGAATYTQNIRVRFLQPPPVPPPGPIIIREVRPPQPPVPPPLRITQRAPPLPTPPPLILRERPPVPPPVLPGRTIVRNLPPVPVPPRSLIIERLPAPPRRPRDIFIERWLQYGPQAKQRTIVQRAGAAHVYAAPRNTIIQYEAVPARVVRNFQRLGVTSYSPVQYVQQYGASLLDAATLVTQARAAGVVEDLSPPGVVGVSASWGASGAVEGGAVVDAGVVGVGGAWGSGGVAGGSWESSSGLAGSSWESSSGLVGGSVVDAGASWGASGASGSWGASGLVGTGTLLGNVADAAFQAGDLDRSGGLDRAEFNNLLTGGGADANLATRY